MRRSSREICSAEEKLCGAVGASMRNRGKYSVSKTIVERLCLRERASSGGVSKKESKKEAKDGKARDENKSARRNESAKAKTSK